MGLERAEKELFSLWIFQGPPGCAGRVVGEGRNCVHRRHMESWEAQRLSSDSRRPWRSGWKLRSLGCIPEPTSDGHEFCLPPGLTLHIKLILSLFPSVNRCLLNNCYLSATLLNARAAHVDSKTKNTFLAGADILSFLSPLFLYPC